MTGRPRNQPIIVEGRPYWRCSRCKEPLPVSRFTRNNARHNGLQGWCIVCATKGNKRHALKQRIRRAERDLAEYRAALEALE